MTINSDGANSYHHPFPRKKSAVALAKTLIDQHLVACVNVLNPCTSIYRWQGHIESTDEIPVLIKTQ